MCFIQVSASKDNSSFPVILFLACIVIVQMLNQTFLHIFGFANIHAISTIILLAKQEIHTGFCDVLTIAVFHVSTRNLDGFSIPVGKFCRNQTIRIAIHQK